MDGALQIQGDSAVRALRPDQAHLQRVIVALPRELAPRVTLTPPEPLWLPVSPGVVFPIPSGPRSGYTWGGSAQRGALWSWPEPQVSVRQEEQQAPFEMGHPLDRSCHEKLLGDMVCPVQRAPGGPSECSPPSLAGVAKHPRCLLVAPTGSPGSLNSCSAAGWPFPQVCSASLATARGHRWGGRVVP